jgi:hypothetical protein
MRFNAHDDADGCMNRVISPGPIEKSCQLITTRLARWLIVVIGVPLPLIVAFPSPPTTLPPIGFAEHTPMPSVNPKFANHNDTILIFIHALPDSARDSKGVSGYFIANDYQ